MSENLYNFTMNDTLNSSNTTRTEADGTINSHDDRVYAALLFLASGSAFCLVNILLVIYFTRTNQFTKTTFIFLCNLGLSDIALGLCMCAYGMIVFLPSFTAAGRIIFRFGAVCACTMSAWCILMISVQVSLVVSLKVMSQGLGFEITEPCPGTICKRRRTSKSIILFRVLKVQN